jgi:hypothetical protein
VVGVFPAAAAEDVGAAVASTLRRRALRHL